MFQHMKSEHRIELIITKRKLTGISADEACLIAESAYAGVHRRLREIDPRHLGT